MVSDPTAWQDRPAQRVKPWRGAPDTAGTVAVVGMGKIGLPLAAPVRGGRVARHRRGRPAATWCDTLNAGRVHFAEEPGLAERIAAAHAAGRFEATLSHAEAAARADVVVMIVPLMLSDEQLPDYRMIDPATDAVAVGLRPGTLVIYETTVPVGDTRRRFGPALERGSGLASGDGDAGFLLAFSPERVFSGRIFHDLATLSQARRRRRPGQHGAGPRLLPQRPAGPRAGTSRRPRRRSSPSWPRRPTATSTSRWPTSSPGTPSASGSMSSRPSAAPTASPSRTSTSRASGWAATASPSTPTSSSAARRSCRSPSWRGASTTARWAWRSARCSASWARWKTCRCWSWGSPTARGSRSWPTPGPCRSSSACGSTARSCPPTTRCSRRPRSRAWVSRPGPGAPRQPARAVVLQTADPRFRDLDPAWLPDLTVIYDGRNVLRGLPARRRRDATWASGCRPCGPRTDRPAA